MAFASLIIRNAQVLLPSGEIEPREVAISQGKIAAVGTELSVADDVSAINASGLTMLPGLIDPHVHFREPGLEYKEDFFTATCACAKGGITSFLDMPDTLPLTITQEALTNKLALAASKSLVNYGFFIGATADNLSELRSASPVCGIKVFMGSVDGPLLLDTVEKIESVFATGDRLIAIHAEDRVRIEARSEQFAEQMSPAVHSEIKDNQAALNATMLAIQLSKKYQRRLHILHLSTGEEAELLRRDKPSWVTAEVTPQHLLLDEIAYEKIGTLAQVDPALKSEGDRELLWQALLDGVIDFIATDHTPHTLEEKSQSYPHSPSGMPGVETALPLMLTQAKENRCTIAQVSNWMSAAVARAYQIQNKGLIEPGYDADLVLVDLTTYRPVLRQELKTKCGWSPFEGWTLTGWPVITIVGGQIVYNRGKIDTDARGQALQFG